MPAIEPADLRRPYLVIPKLIDQPTWGGAYIVEAKGWADRGDLGRRKIGQSYELFSGSNLSLLDDTAHSAFEGELTDRDAVQIATTAPHAIPLASLMAADAAATLGAERVQSHGGHLDLLLKFTQALGNSFQVHIKAGLTHPKYKPKPESWYYFEPGLVTLGVKPGIDWAAYEQALTDISAGMGELSAQVTSGHLARATADARIAELLKTNDPWQYVNEVAPKAGDLVDLSSGALHHSWEEDPDRAPRGNVLYEIQSEAMDDISTFRGFDKGKMGQDGSVRAVHVKEYFEFIDRTPELNDPHNHIHQPRNLTRTHDFTFDHLLETPYYCLDQLEFTGQTGLFRDTISTFKHLFVKTGQIRVTAGGHGVIVGAGHSAFVPAAAHEYQVENLAGPSQVIISY